jgi:hypothetical protein
MYQQSKIIKNHIDKGLIGFYTSYRDVPWKDLLVDAKDSIDIVVYYWHKWMGTHQAEIARFLDNPRAKLRIFLADENKPAILADIWRLFPNQTVVQLKEKIRGTYEPLEDFKNVQVYRYPHTLNYSMQCIDEKILVLSFFDMHRVDQVDSPAIIIDLDQSPQLKEFYLKEIQELLKASR